ncbi:hypothetical protein HYW30_01620 [Candidatus Azambacteria bacterium]|nr:hypothetical protein [Candidatus Azambacteria bacterium]
MSRGFSGLVFLAIGAGLILLLLYVFETNAIVSRTFTLRTMKEEVRAGEHDVKRLEVSLAEAQSLEALGKVGETAKLERVGKVAYVVIRETNVAYGPSNVATE